MVLDNPESEFATMAWGNSAKCSLPPRSFAIGTNPTRPDRLCLIVSGCEGKNSNAYFASLGGVVYDPSTTPDSYASCDDSDGEIGRMCAELKTLHAARALTEEEYYDINLPPIMCPGVEALLGASREERASLCNFYVSVQQHMLDLISYTLSRSLDYVVRIMIEEVKEVLRGAKKNGDAEVSLKTLLKPVSKLNPKQKRARKDYFDDIRDIADALHGDGRVVNPNSNRPEDIDVSLSTMDDKNSHIYIKRDQKKSGGGTKNKCGATYTGNTKHWHYMEDYERAKAEAVRLGLDDVPLRPELISVVNIDNLPLSTELKLVEKVLSVSGKHACKRRPETLTQCVMYEIYNLSIGTGLHFRSLVCSEEECSEGGAINVSGMLKRIVLHVVESSVSLYLSEKRGMTISGQVHELVAGSYVLAIALHKTEECAKAVSDQVELEPEQVQVKMEEEAVQTSILSTWAPYLKDPRKKGDLLSPIVMSKSTYNWKDTLPRVKWEDTQNGSDMYAHKKPNHGYTMDDLSTSCRRKDKKLRAFTAKGGGAMVVDEDKLSMKARGNQPMAKYIISNFFGPGGEKYVVRRTYLDCTVLVMNCEDGEVRRIYVNGCPGFIGDTNPNVKHDDEGLTRQLLRCQSWQFSQNSLRSHSLEGCSMSDFLVTWMDDPTEDNLILNWLLSFGHDKRRRSRPVSCLPGRPTSKTLARRATSCPRS